ncbi:uncharacterized protein BDZ99DRAFT_310922 [Mytilinidion resinicola]|uniref:Fe2OG dioxygenase domain-containing protein n=1 Tax=Mytilinidion resinicola TaxID=574789 RepID=A0A6A6YP99_9PEZI|nr:uncharacterized protein BDZ99DRAFT_310922 [Mytilinidion resinicola]KAF2810403.1 hypothetical protein BDZ99DRAFT_310922 [Mytilinidion resinicola]
MATVATQSMAAVPMPKFRPIIEHVTTPQTAAAADFDPKKHLNFSPPSEVVMMKDLGYADDCGVSPVAVSQPFPLFSQEAIRRMRSEIMKPEVLDKCTYRSNIAASQLRGYAPKYAPFTYDAWSNPDTLSIISKIAGVDLVPQFDYEIGHINFSVKSDEETNAEIGMINKQKEFFADDEGIAGCPWEDDKPVVGWHNDSYPFVCVLMLSDCTNMVGGETALRTGNGDILKVRGPQMGCAVVLQGRYITHQALRALGAKERITSVTSFRPKSALVRDDTELRTVRPISDLSRLYYDFAEYRLENLEERTRVRLKELRERRRAGKKIDTVALKKWMTEQLAFLEHTNGEIVEEDKVMTGYIDEIPDEPVEETAERPTKRARVE